MRDFPEENDTSTHLAFSSQLTATSATMTSSTSTPEDVILHIYELHADNNASGSSSSAGANSSSAAADNSDPAAATSAAVPTPATNLLPFLRTIGLGTYHTSIELRSKCYSFAAGAGIVQSTPPSSVQNDRYAPTNARYLERIVLGSTTLDRGKVNEIINKLRSTSFTPTSYHLLNRNCNHFTTTFATAVLHHDRLADAGYTPKLEAYPSWVNRLARTGTGLGCLNDTDVCNVVREARMATGAEDRVGWELNKPAAESGSGAGTGASGKGGGSSSKKKELTEEQKKILAKLKKKG